MMKHKKAFRLSAIVSGLMLATMMPAAPAYAEPNCAVEAYLMCKDGAWVDIGYASEAECREFEQAFCERGSGPTPGYSLIGGSLTRHTYS